MKPTVTEELEDEGFVVPDSLWFPRFFAVHDYECRLHVCQNRRVPTHKNKKIKAVRRFNFRRRWSNFIGCRNTFPLVFQCVRTSKDLKNRAIFASKVTMCRPSRRLSKTSLTTWNGIPTPCGGSDVKAIFDDLHARRALEKQAEAEEEEKKA